MAAQEEVDTAGSDSYRDDHFTKMFREGFSFSGFERDDCFLSRDGERFLKISGVSGIDSESDGRAAVFADIGQVWESWGVAAFDLSVGAGVGIRWATPIGPLWADVAWPLVNTGISSTKPKFYVGIGRPF